LFALVNKAEPTGNDGAHPILRSKKIEQLILKKSGARTPVSDDISALESTGIPACTPPSAGETPNHKKKAVNVDTGQHEKNACFGKADRKTRFV
jgi:hypothetical protein